MRDLAELRADVVNLVRSPDVVEVFPSLVARAEVRINRAARTRHNLTTQALVVVGGRTMLPYDFAEVVGVYQGRAELAAQPVQFARTQPGYYAIQGDEIVHAGSGSMVMDYFAKVPPLAADTSSNWVLENYPLVYLYAVGAEAAIWLRDAAMAEVMQGALDRELAAMARDAVAQQFARARVRLKGPTP